jgi:hypothetical protein
MPYGVAGGIGSDTKCRNLESLFCRETEPKLTTSKESGNWGVRAVFIRPSYCRWQGLKKVHFL